MLSASSLALSPGWPAGERDSMQQVRIGIGALQGCPAERVAGC
jgi:hypothetical protein